MTLRRLRTVIVALVKVPKAILFGLSWAWCVYLMGQCSGNEVAVDYQIGTGSYPSEISWLLNDAAGNTVFSGGASESGTWCLAEGQYTFIGLDSYGDGWDGAVAEFFANGIMIGSLAVESSLGSVVLVVSNDIPGCTNADADNYNPTATIDDGSCCLNNIITIELYAAFGDGWTVGEQWGWLVLDGDSTEFSGGSNLTVELCLTEGCYTGQIVAPTYESEASWEAYDSSGSLINSGGTGTIFFYAGSDDCVVTGCTDSNACNYNENANLDDEYCEFLSCAGCIDPIACNFDPNATIDNGSCLGCDDYFLREVRFWGETNSGAVVLDTTYLFANDGGIGEAVESELKLQLQIPELPEEILLHIQAKGRDLLWGSAYKKLLFQPSAIDPTPIPAWALQQGEMFFGEDPGEGNGIPLMSESGAIAETAHGYLQEGWPFEDTLLPGVLGVRVLDGSGAWSPVFRTLLWTYDTYPVLPDTLIDRNVQSVEFFLGEEDPGEGQGIALNYIDFGWDEAIEAAITYIDSLPGVDPVKFNLRAKDYRGDWGVPFVKWVWTLGRTNQTTGRPIHPMAAEYFIGSEDPGEGLANPISSLDGDWDEAVEDLFRSQVTWYEQDLPAVLSVRTKDGNGDWGLTFKKIIWPSDEYLNVELLDNDLAVAVCPGDTAYVPYTGPAGTTPTWFNGANDLTLGFVPETSGYYTVEVTVGVDTYIDSTFVTLLPVPQADVAPDGLFLLCVGSPNQVLQSITDQPDVQWYLDGVEISQNDSIYVVGTGDYWFTSTNPETQCTSTSQTVVVTNAPDLSLVCDEALGWALTFGSEAQGATTDFAWELNGVPFDAQGYFPISEPGIYTVGTSNANCESVAQLEVTMDMLDASCLAGCTDSEACNYNAMASIEDGSCDYPEAGYDCDGICVADVDEDGICDPEEIYGCPDMAACNYSASATEDDGSCLYFDPCPAPCDSDVDGDLVCDEDEVAGCTDVLACNYASTATDEDGSCLYPNAGEDCSGECLADSDGDGVCDPNEINGCNDELALNFDLNATENDGTCEFSPSRLTKAECFFGDVDPGEGMGIELFVLDGQWDEAIESVLRENVSWTANDTTLWFNIRVANDLGAWGHLFRKSLNVLQDPELPTLITTTFQQAEFFFGILDPGAGNGYPLLAADGAFDEAVEDLLRTNLAWPEMDLPALLRLRLRDEWGNWGETFTKVVWPIQGLYNSNLVAQGDSISLCPEDSLTLDFVGPNTHTVTWFDGSNGESLTFKPNATGYYFVESTDGYLPFQDSIHVTILPSPALTTNPAGFLLACPAASAFIVTADSDQPLLTWFRNGAEINSVSPDTSINVTQTGSFTVLATNPVTECQTLSDALIVETVPEIALECDPELGWVLTLGTQVSSTGTTLTWRSNGELLSNESFVAVQEPGVYSVTLASDYCNASLEFPLTEDMLESYCLAGCIDDLACNFNADASIDDGSCEYPLPGNNCENECVEDVDGDGVCDPDEIPGCTNPTACNYNFEATDDDGSCDFDCSEPCIVDTDLDGVCDEDEVLGCTDTEACNFNGTATEEDGSCTFPEEGYACDGSCASDLDGDGVCDVFEVFGCTDPLALNYSDTATQDNGLCLLPPGRLVGAEFWLGTTDPGEGLGSPLSASDALWNEAVEHAFSMFQAELTEGPTMINIRARQDDGDWGPAMSKVLFFPEDVATTNLELNLIEAEYFIGIFDPGEGNGTPMLVQDGAWDQVIEGLIRTSLTWLLPDGITMVNVRVKDINGQWSPNFRKPVWPQGSNPGVNLIAEGDSIVVCAADALGLNFIGPNTFAASWENGETGTSNMSNPTQGWYTVSATDGTTVLQDSIFVEVLPSASLVVSSEGYQLVCEDGLPQVFAAESPEGLPVQWYFNGATSSVGPTLSAELPGTYHASVTNEYGCTTTSNDIVLSLAPMPELVCAGSFAYLSITSSDLAESEAVVWTLPDGSELSNVTSVLVESTGDYEVILDNGTCDESFVYTITADVLGQSCGLSNLLGCTDPQACNYDPSAVIDDASCDTPVEGYDCEGNCTSDEDEDGICDGDEIPGCTDLNACNFDPEATESANNCYYPNAVYNCDGLCQNDEDEDGVCDELEDLICGSSSCEGPDCCADGTTWDPEMEACIPSCGPGSYWDPLTGFCIVPDSDPESLCGPGTIWTGSICVPMCTDDQYWNSEQLTCSDLEDPLSFCGSGTLWDDESGTCMSVCGPGFGWDSETSNCVPLTICAEPEVYCGPGTIWDDVLQECILICGDGFAWVEALQQCIQVTLGSDATACGEGTVWDELLEQCIPSPETICGEGTSWDEELGVCVVSSITSFCGDGTVWDEELETCIGLPSTPGSDYCGAGTVWDEDLGACIALPIDEGCPGDLFADGMVNTLDLLTFLTLFGTECD